LGDYKAGLGCAERENGTFPSATDDRRNASTNVIFRKTFEEEMRQGCYVQVRCIWRLDQKWGVRERAH
jgi:hypothetical protein